MVCPTLACADRHHCCLLLLLWCLNFEPRCTRLWHVLTNQLLSDAAVVLLHQVVGDRSCIKEYLRLQSSALALPQDPTELAKAKPFAVEVSVDVCEHVVCT